MGKKKKPKKSTEQWVTDLKGIAAEELRVLAQAIEITLEKGEITVSQAQKDMIAKIAHPSQNVEEEEDTAMEAQTEEQVPSPEPPALEPPSDEEGFARVPTKRKRKDRSSPIPNSDDDEQVSGDPPAGPSWSREDGQKCRNSCPIRESSSRKRNNALKESASPCRELTISAPRHAY
jgi:hypothetical protein